MSRFTAWIPALAILAIVGIILYKMALSVPAIVQVAR